MARVQVRVTTNVRLAVAVIKILGVLSPFLGTARASAGASWAANNLIYVKVGRRRWRRLKLRDPVP